MYVCYSLYPITSQVYVCMLQSLSNNIKVYVCMLQSLSNKAYIHILVMLLDKDCSIHTYTLMLFDKDCSIHHKYMYVCYSLYQITSQVYVCMLQSLSNNIKVYVCMLQSLSNNIKVYVCIFFLLFLVFIQEIHIHRSTNTSQFKLCSLICLQ